jgi:hypothetical protein
MRRWDDLSASGVYLDRILNKGDRSRFVKRIVVGDSGRCDKLLACWRSHCRCVSI